VTTLTVVIHSYNQSRNCTRIRISSRRKENVVLAYAGRNERKSHCLRTSALGRLHLESSKTRAFCEENNKTVTVEDQWPALINNVFKAILNVTAISTSMSKDSKHILRHRALRSPSINPSRTSLVLQFPFIKTGVTVARTCWDRKYNKTFVTSS
jgi:hypothetical protein